MRTFLVLAAVLIGALLTLDHFVFDGQYRQATWREAKHQGEQFNRNIRYWFRKIG
jgi:hypothetical protein